MPANPVHRSAVGALAVDNNHEVGFTIRSYEPRDHKGVCELFVDGMMEYCPPGENEILRSYVLESLDLDLANIEATYARAGGHFWVVATTAKDNAEGDELVVGTIAIERNSDDRGELRRLTVSKSFRRHGLARQLVAQLETWAGEHRFRVVHLNTGSEMEQAIRFYEAIGYKRTDEEVLQREPYQSLIFFEKELTDRSLENK